MVLMEPVSGLPAKCSRKVINYRATTSAVESRDEAATD